MRKEGGSWKQDAREGEGGWSGQRGEERERETEIEKEMRGGGGGQGGVRRGQAP